MENANKQFSQLRSFTRYLATSNLRLLASRVEQLPLFHAVWVQKAHVMEIILIVGFYLVYLLTRGLIYSDQSGAGLVNAERIISMERSLGFFWEPGWQSWILSYAPGLARFFNWTYIFTYVPIIAVVGLILYFANRPRYHYFRSVMAINLVFALLIFMFFPVTSPFNVSQYFVNTIQELGPSFYGSAGMAPAYNAHAAMPSLHFSWTVILGVLFLGSFKGCSKLIGIAYPATTFFAIIITGNHFILDALVGGALALAAFAVMELCFRGGFFRVRRHLGLAWYEFREMETRYHRAWPRTQERLVSELRRNWMYYWLAWLRTQERLFSELRRNWLRRRVAWLRFWARLPVIFRRRTMRGGGRVT